MRQPSLFDSVAEKPEPRPVNVEFIRKNLLARLAMLKRADFMPWNGTDLAHWEKEFPRLARHLPEPEREEVVAAFFGELSRLKDAA